MRRIGHRGAPREFPGNTLRGFARAAERGCDMVECDVRRAADGVLVLAHDPNVTDAAGRSFTITQHDSATLQALDLGAGEGVPTLDELVAWAALHHVEVMADMKCEGDGVEAAVCAALVPLATDAKIVPGAGEESRRRFREIDLTLPLSLSLGRQAEAALQSGAFDQFLQAPDTEAVTWEYPLLTRPRIVALQERGLRVYTWTVDDPEIMRRLREDGVDGIISNRADLL